MEPEKRALIYCRVSSERQKVEGHGLESQEHRCRTYAQQKGYPVEAVFPDSFTGGGNFMARPAMAALLLYLDEHRSNSYVVIFDDLKRFARDTTFHFALRRELHRRKATVECLNFRFEDTPEGIFVETVFAAQGELEREQNRRQVIQKQRARLERGYWPFNPPPGYKSRKHPNHGKLLRPNGAIARMIAEALEGFASRRFETQSDVQQFLATNRFPTGTGRVHLELVKRLLTRVIYSGYVEYPPWGVSLRKGHHTPLISLATYQRIQERLRATVKVYDRATLRSEFPLRGFVRCLRCRALYTASCSTGRSARYPYYRCTGHLCSLRTKSIPKERMEAHFEGELRKVRPVAQRLTLVEVVIHDLWQEMVEKVEAHTARRAQELKQVERQIASFVTRLKNASSAAVISLYEKEVEALSLRKLALEEAPLPDRSGVQLGTATEEVLGNLKDPLALWRKDVLADRRWLLKVLFEQPLLYDPEEGFGTAELSLPLAVSRAFKSSKSQGVEMVKKNWNRLERFILEAYESRRSMTHNSTDPHPPF